MELRAATASAFLFLLSVCQAEEVKIKVAPGEFWLCEIVSTALNKEAEGTISFLEAVEHEKWATVLSVELVSGSDRVVYGLSIGQRIRTKPAEVFQRFYPFEEGSVMEPLGNYNTASALPFRLEWVGSGAFRVQLGTASPKVFITKATVDRARIRISGGTALVSLKFGSSLMCPAEAIARSTE